MKFFGVRGFLATAVLVFGASASPSPSAFAATPGTVETISPDVLLKGVSPAVRATAHFTAPGVVEFNGGSVRLIYGTAADAQRKDTAAATSALAVTGTTYVHGCPKGSSTKWFCFYQHDDWNEYQAGRMLQFKDSGLQSLADYGFSDQTTSWVNTTGSKVYVYDSTSGSGNLWTESANSSSSNVGAANNDRASSFRR